MVAVIRPGRSIRRTFHYNENKVKAGCAELLMAENYPVAAEHLTESQRLNMLLRTAESNPNVEANSIHISLNFAVGERLTEATMKAIASEYMEAIGFGNQPYLVYRHDDAAHPHLHIATVKVGLDGERIETQNIGKNLSEPARKALEKKYGLVRAEDHQRQVFTLIPVDATKVIYGISETRKAIGNVLETVLKKYKYASLAELNAVLGLYNVSAERGSEDSRTYKRRGLLYRVLDEKGKPIGVPIKASLFYNRPTLEKLEMRFLKNDVARQPHKEKLKSTIDFTIRSAAPASLESLDEALKNSRIRMVIRKSKEGLAYGITYVDMRSKCVFNGSALGKSYSAKGLTDRLRLEQQADKLQQTFPLKKDVPSRVPAENPHEKSADPLTESKEISLLERLMQYEYASQYVPYEWRKKKKKKKKR